MTSRTSERFRALMAALPADVRQRARTAYRQFAQNPAHPSLHFKQVHSTKPVYSARIDLSYRAVALRTRNEQGEALLLWFWVGPHTEYDQLLAKL